MIGEVFFNQLMKKEDELIEQDVVVSFSHGA